MPSELLGVTTDGEEDDIEEREKGNASLGWPGLDEEL